MKRCRVSRPIIRKRRQLFALLYIFCLFLFNESFFFRPIAAEILSAFVKMLQDSFQFKLGFLEHIRAVCLFVCLFVCFGG